MRNMRISFMCLVLLSCRCDIFVKGGRPNRPVKTIKTTAGDVFDCVDIYKQPAFDHPLLQDHHILMQPKVAFKNFAVEEGPKAINDTINMELEGGGCPDGTVPIHRLPEKNSTAPHYANYPNSNNNDDRVTMWATRRAKWRTYYGASSKINVYGVNPVGPKQVSAVMIWVVNQAAPSKDQIPVVEAGWSVDPGLYNDGKTRLTIACSRDGTQTMCLNLQCPAFVQTSSKIALGSTIWPLSTYKGTQYYVYLHIYKDDKNNWWFAYGDVKNTIGYWPAELFGNFEHATWVDFGGFVGCPKGEACPPMGSGVKPDEESSCTMEQVQVIGPDHKWGGLGKSRQRDNVTKKKCYDVGRYNPDVHAYKFAFGGPPCTPNH